MAAVVIADMTVGREAVRTTAWEMQRIGCLVAADVARKPAGLEEARVMARMEEERSDMAAVVFDRAIDGLHMVVVGGLSCWAVRRGRIDFDQLTPKSERFPAWAELSWPEKLGSPISCLSTRDMHLTRNPLHPGAGVSSL